MIATFSQLKAGALLCGRYRICDRIADGAYATVYLADDEIDGQRYALKILDPLKGADPVGRLRFEREFDLLRRLDHPRIARCHRLERDGELDILVLEYVEGETLRDRLDQGRLEIDEAIGLAAGIAEGLEACHHQSILHRDLKPANVVIHPERGPVILDFGVAWFSTALNLTRTGAVVGSPQYLAPEVFASSVSDERADLYSLGVILFEMLTGRPVHLVQSVAELAIVHLREEPPSASSLRPGISPELDQVVDKALTTSAADRFATAAEFREALERGSVATAGALRKKLPCPDCATPLIINLAFCPGCGKDTDWRLEPGPYAVQITKVDDQAATLAWLRERFSESFRTTPSWVARRLQILPIPLVVGASAATAERLVAEAKDVGCEVEIVRSRAVTGARLRAASASAAEVLVASLLHLAAVVVCALTLRLLDASLTVIAATPTILAIAGIWLASRYVRLPVLVCRQKDATATGRQFDRIRQRLAGLRQGRARKLAASAVARAAPLLLGRSVGISDVTAEEITEALDSALQNAEAVDLHGGLLLARPRSQLAQEIDAAKQFVLRDEKGASKRLRELEHERDDLARTALAHDLAARDALQACAQISRLFLTRTHAEAVLSDDADRQWQQMLAR